MPELNQPQSLRDLRVTRGLEWIAQRLASWHPNDPMTVNAARTYADKTHPGDSNAATELERQLLRRMPFVDGRTVTRGEYALWLHKTSWGA